MPRLRRSVERSSVVRSVLVVLVMTGMLIAPQRGAAQQPDMEESGSFLEVTGGATLGLVAGAAAAAGTFVGATWASASMFGGPPKAVYPIAATMIVGGAVAGGFIGDEGELGTATLGLLVGAGSGALLGVGISSLAGSTSDGRLVATVFGTGVGALAGFIIAGLVLEDDDADEDSMGASVRAPLIAVRF